MKSSTTCLAVEHAATTARQLPERRRRLVSAGVEQAAGDAAHQRQEARRGVRRQEPPRQRLAVHQDLLAPRRSRCRTTCPPDSRPSTPSPRPSAERREQRTRAGRGARSAAPIQRSAPARRRRRAARRSTPITGTASHSLDACAAPRRSRRRTGSRRAPTIDTRQATIAVRTIVPTLRLLERAADLLEREHHAGDRRVERGRDAGRTAGEDQAAVDQVARERGEAVREVHEARADVHRRALAADRRSEAERQHQQQHLAERDAQRQHVRARRALARS